MREASRRGVCGTGRRRVPGRCAFRNPLSPEPPLRQLVELNRECRVRAGGLNGPSFQASGGGRSAEKLVGSSTGSSESKTLYTEGPPDLSLKSLGLDVELLSFLALCFWVFVCIGLDVPFGGCPLKIHARCVKLSTMVKLKWQKGYSFGRPSWSNLAGRFPWLAADDCFKTFPEEALMCLFRVCRQGRFSIHKPGRPVPRLSRAHPNVIMQASPRAVTEVLNVRS